jgi:hypothetical protein
VPSLTGIFGAFICATFKWLYPRHKEWKVERKATAEIKVDEKVLSSLFIRGLTAGIFDAWQIAKVTSLDRKSVADSLERPDARGRVIRLDGRYDHPAANWKYR